MDHSRKTLAPVSTDLVLAPLRTKSGFIAQTNIDGAVRELPLN